MNRLKNWCTPFYLVLAVGIVGFSAYGIYHTARALDDIRQSPAVISSASDYSNVTAVTGGSACHPLGCAACGACSYLQQQVNIENLPDSSVQIQSVY